MNNTPNFTEYSVGIEFFGFSMMPTEFNNLDLCHFGFTCLSSYVMKSIKFCNQSQFKLKIMIIPLNYEYK